MAGLVTKESNLKVEDFIQNIGHPGKEADARILVGLFEEVSGSKAKVWGNEKVPYFLVGFGKFSYQRKGSKEEFEWFKLGFAARKTKLTLYLSLDISQEEKLLEKLGKCTYGKGCLYINKLADVDLNVLKVLLEKGKEPNYG